jgi:hypothetical protein
MDLGAESLMNAGQRIGNYRNSTPRFIKLLGLGKGGSKLAKSVADRGFANDDVTTDLASIGWSELMAGGPCNSRVNMVVIVCAEGDEALFKPDHARPDVMVTFVVVRPGIDGTETSSFATARACSDLFVTTSDLDYVPELIANLAS